MLDEKCRQEAENSRKIVFYCVFCSLHIYTVVPPKNFYLIRISKKHILFAVFFLADTHKNYGGTRLGCMFNLYVFGISAR